MTKGVRDCVSLVLAGWAHVVALPTTRSWPRVGRWVRADELVLGQDRVVVGWNARWTNRLTTRVATCSARANSRSPWTRPCRLRTLAFARLLGHLLGDGSISASGQGRMNVGQAIDREVVLNDIELLTGKRPAATQYDERKWSIVLPMKLTEAIVALPGVRVAARIDQAPRCPHSCWTKSCPVAVVREFLGGVFGADGTCAYSSRLSER